MKYFFTFLTALWVNLAFIPSLQDLQGLQGMFMSLAIISAFATLDYIINDY